MEKSLIQGFDVEDVKKIWGYRKLSGLYALRRSTESLNEGSHLEKTLETV